jgi:polynucleotide 5'-kinase involved in rRNA processing
MSVSITKVHRKEERKSRDERKEGRNREIRKIKECKETEIGIRIAVVYTCTVPLC